MSEPRDIYTEPADVDPDTLADRCTLTRIAAPTPNPIATRR